ncbi:hypothetical protein FEM48_Zijuj04G0178000 [Ziziphus jujuba var. spinosa]|uniref:Uncharacterized protein n=1 Tax=Ziziphus jujuba var. spinosa TaxID=714518 RepID=A0A978VLA5_ZIZJJ|nr:hypothetical protein FEM48_Zijuj04G0178000 [Ziziphus jujuba var. spinosa]
MATKLASPFMIPNRPFMQPALPCLKRRGGGLSVAASKGTNGRDYEGKLVDENMIELRIRIQEMKMLEMGDEQPPSDWMEWEKDYFEHYKEDVYEGIGLLQNWLMNVRPSLALGFVALSEKEILRAIAARRSFIFGISENRSRTRGGKKKKKKEQMEFNILAVMKQGDIKSEGRDVLDAVLPLLKLLSLAVIGLLIAHPKIQLVPKAALKL